MMRWIAVTLLAAALACTRGGSGRPDTAHADSMQAPGSSRAADTAATAPADLPPSDTSSSARNTDMPSKEPPPPPRPPAPGPSTPPSRGDTARGTVRLVGSLPVDVSVVLQRESGGAPLRLTGEPTGALRGMGGVDVVVRGRSTPSGEFEVSSFLVRSVNGERAVDGVIVSDGQGLALQTETGRRRLGNPPAAFRSLVGSRVWITGPLDTGPNVYGVIKS